MHRRRGSSHPSPLPERTWGLIEPRHDSAKLCRRPSYQLHTTLTLEQRELTETVRSSADALLTIINDILDFSKIEAGKLSIETTDFDLRAAIEGVVELMAEHAHRKGLELASLIYHDVPTQLRGDPGRLRQVLTNLVSNAIEFTAHGEVIWGALGRSRGRGLREHQGFFPGL